MNREVYAYILRTYGRNPLQWVGLAMEAFHVFVLRVYIVILMAQVTSSIAAGDLDAAKKYTLYFLLAYIVGAIVGTLAEMLSTYVEEKEYERQMITFYQKLVGKDISFYRDNQTGYLASVFRQYLDSSMLLNRFFRGEALGVVVSLLVPPAVLFAASPSVGLIAAAIVIIQGMYVMWSSSKVTEYRKMSHEIYRKVSGEVSDVITNIIAFKAGGVEDRSRSKVMELAKQEVNIFWQRRKVTVLLDSPRNVMTACGIAASVYLIITNTTDLSPASLGLIVMVLTYMFQIVRNVAVLPKLITEHDDLVTKLYPALQYLSDDYESVRDPANPTPFNVTSGAIDIDAVSFGYRSHTNKGVRIPVFEDLSISITGGEQVGVVGLSGAGKSTLASLLLRFDDVDEGAIRIDGTDIRNVKQSELRRNIAYVPQEPLLFHRSIRENIAYYDEAKSEEDIIRAAKAAHAHEFIEKLPQSYNTMVGERGIKLSGGQKQRIAIARAILKKAPIMIFDEATSALDSESEQIIQRALPEILGKQTAIVVAHRLSTVAGLDRIIVMHDGAIEEAGTHAELLAQKGRYYSLWQKQTAEFGKA